MIKIIGIEIWNIDNGSVLKLKASKVSFPSQYQTTQNVVPGKYELSEHDNMGFKISSFTITADYIGHSGASIGLLSREIKPFFMDSGAKLLTSDYTIETWREVPTAITVQTPSGGAATSGVMILIDTDTVENRPLASKYDSSLAIKGIIQGV